jgi:hypothetical protein
MPVMSTWQSETLFSRPKTISIPIDQDHELVKLSGMLDWRKLIIVAMERRAEVRKSTSGPEPEYRALLGALTLMSVKNLQYRDVEDLIRNYVPARCLCDLLESDWSPDFATIFQFQKMLGPAGIQQLNEEILKFAECKGLADPRELMSDTTAQEARIPYPNEAGLMNRFMGLVEKKISRLRGSFDKVKDKVRKAVTKTKGLLRNAHLFAKGREQKRKIEKKMYHTAKEIQSLIASTIDSGANMSSKAARDLLKLNSVMKDLLPQIRHFLTTGFVAAKKIIHLQMPEVYAIVRGKAGKSVEFGIKWGINRIGGGFLSGFLIQDGRNCSDTAFCMESVRRHIAVFGTPPVEFGFDRGGDCDSNLKRIKRLGVKHVGIAPRGKKKWSVPEKLENKIKRARAQVEGSIGTIKSSRYGFTKPRAHSKPALVGCGHRAILGFNMRKLVIMSAANAT